ncbi:MAG: hypothetical protein JNJ45_00290 [Chthonomonas sp.]|nr:hypothetical protein [Chthonomonas sp.]
MTTASKVGIGFGIALVALFGLKFALGRPTDEEAIQAALKEALQASREGRPGAVLDFVSRNLKVNSEEAQGAGRGEVANYIRNAKPDIEVLNPKPVITGDTATIASPVKVSVRIAMVQLPAVTIDARIGLAKESGREWLIIPVPKWRVTEIQADNIPSELTGN